MTSRTPTGDLLLFGYGSLIFKQNFPFLWWQPCVVRGWRRVFYQGSTDHRGTPERPGRVVTLLEDAAADCSGIVFCIAHADVDQVLTALDIREKGGYEQLMVECREPHGGTIGEALCYVAMPSNSEFIGPATEEAIAAHVATCTGPSGPNRDYVMKLAESLRFLQLEDPHVFAIDAVLRESLGAEVPASALTEAPLPPQLRRSSP